MHLAWQSALTLAVHINLRQASLVLFVILIISILIIGLRDSRINLLALIKRVIIVIIPPLLVYFTWRFHVAEHLSGAEFTIRPFENWLTDLIPEILIAMLTVASKKGVYFLAVGSNTCVWCEGDCGEWKHRLIDWLFGKCNVCRLQRFSLFTYVAAFGKSDALRVASYWRYNIHVGCI